MSDKKCKMCGATSEQMWVCDDELFCECCLCTVFGIHKIVPPRRCEQCGTPIKGAYFIDNDEDNAFCSRECALAYWDAVRCEEEESETEK